MVKSLTSAVAAVRIDPVTAPRLDAIDRRLLLLLSKDGRRAGSDLARQLGLSRQAVAERIRDLERRGLVRGYTAEVDPAPLGLSVRAHIRLALDTKAGSKGEKDVVKQLAANPMVRSVHRVSGEDCFVVQLVCRRIEDVNGVLAELQKTRAILSSRTAFVLETLVEKGAFGELDESLLPEEPR
jgi:Lrp/AsnC family leucine-responsive transcriptional regulator